MEISQYFTLHELGYMHRHHLMVATNGPLVYVRNLKCASTFFYESFLKLWRWEEMNWMDIDWENQHVFGHISDPIERRHKGVAEFISMCELEDLFNQNKNFQNFVKFAPVLDQHSSSYHDTFGESCYQIDWIPITDYSHQQVVNFTENLMSNWGISHCVGRWDYTQAHQSTPAKKAIEHKIKELYNSEARPPEYLSWYFHKDQLLYKSICRKFNPQGTTWTEISWLRS